MKKNNSALWAGILIFIVIVVLFAWPRFSNPFRKSISIWKNIGVACLPSHQNANLHIHASLNISTDGAKEVIPANIGIVQSCMAETHTHETDGAIHIESVEAGKEFTLAQFFSVWEKTIERDGFNVTVTVDGNQVINPGATILKDKQVIEINYARI